MRTGTKYDNLVNWFESTDSIFEDFSRYTLDRKSKKKRRIFMDNGGDVLFVAHVDTVEKPKYYGQRDGILYASGIDDRLGCWIAYSLSKCLGADLLLCDNEEQGESSAFYHMCKDYKWIAEFDRGGEDVVTYDMDSPEFLICLENHFVKIGYGSFSDINSLNIDVCCVNVGIGYDYRKAHSRDSFANLHILKRQIERFVEFYNGHKTINFVQSFYSEPIYDSIGFRNRDVVTNIDGSGTCELCGGIGNKVYSRVVCEECFEEMFAEIFEYTL